MSLLKEDTINTSIILKNQILHIFFLYSDFYTFFKATFKVLIVIWYDNQYFENGRSILFTKKNCQYQNKQISLVECVVVFCVVYDSLKYRSDRKYYFSSP